MIFLDWFDGSARATGTQGDKRARISVRHKSLGVERLENRNLLAGLAPVDISISATSVDENAPANHQVADLFTDDPDTLASQFTYTLVSGPGSDGNGSFNINGQQLRTSESFDAEVDSVYSIRVQTADPEGNTLQKSFLITVNNLNDNSPIFDPDTSSFSINGGTAAVGSVAATDADNLAALVYSIDPASPDAAQFGIDANTGALRFLIAPDFENPADVGGDNIYDVTIEVGDGLHTTQQAVAVTVVQNANEAPTISIAGLPGTYRENSAAKPVAPGAGLSDAEGNFDGGSLTVMIASGLDAAKDQLRIGTGNISVVGSDVRAAGASIGTVDAINNGSGGNPLVVTFHGGASQIAVRDVIRSVTFRTLGDNPSTVQRKIEFLVRDGAGAVSDPATKPLNVIAVNDAPVLNTSLSPRLAAVKEDATNPAGTLVSLLLTGAVSDPDEGALRGIAIGTSSDYHGVWQYRLSKYAKWLPVGSVSESSALLLPGWAHLRFIPNANFAGTAKMYYRAWDQTQGAPGERLKLSGKTGWTNAFSVAKEEASLTVAPVNDPPKLSLSGTVGYRRDAAAITLAPFASVADIDSANFYSGQLRVRISDGASSSNRLLIGSGFSVDANNNVLQGSTIIGKRTSSGIGTEELVITFNYRVTSTIAQQLVRAITFKTKDGAAGQRTILFTLSDGDGGLSDAAMKKVNVT